MPRSLILGLDIGTSSVRASLFDGDGTVLPDSIVKVEQTFTAAPDGASEMDVEVAFDNVVLAIDTLLDQTKELSGEIEMVAPCSYWHSLVGIDRDGEATTKIIGWADTRSRKYSGVLKEAFDQAETHNRTGARFHSSYWPAKLMWLREEHGEAFANTHQWLSFCDLIEMRLSGVSATTVSMASGTGLFDIRLCSFDETLLKFLGIDRSQLSAVADDRSTFALNHFYSKKWSRLAAAKWCFAIGDGAADNIGSGCITRERAALMVGTSGAMRVSWPGEPPPKIPSGLWCYRIDRQRVVMGGALSDGGGLYRWLRANMNLPAEAEQLIAKRPPGVHGINFLPFLFGERGTGYNETATGALIGLTAGHSSVDILQAAMESIAFRFAEIFDHLSTIFSIEMIVASGGALRDSPVWAQIIADVLGRDLCMSDENESSSRGAVLHALESKGKIGNIEKRSDSDVQFIVADPERSKAFSDSRKAHEKFYKLLSQRDSI